MIAAKNFVTWFLQQLPAFFMSEPIIYFIGFIFLGFALNWLLRLCNLK